MKRLDKVPLPDDIETKLSRSERKALIAELINNPTIRAAYTLAQIIKFAVLVILAIYVYESITSQVVLPNFNYNIIIYLSLSWFILVLTIALYAFNHFENYIKRKLRR
jgi:hypothetical protein